MSIDKDIMSYSIKEMNEIFEEETAADIIEGIVLFTNNSNQSVKLSHTFKNCLNYRRQLSNKNFLFDPL